MDYKFENWNTKAVLDITEGANGQFIRVIHTDTTTGTTTDFQYLLCKREANRVIAVIEAHVAGESKVGDRIKMSTVNGDVKTSLVVTILKPNCVAIDVMRKVKGNEAVASRFLLYGSRQPMRVLKDLRGCD